MKRSSFAAGVGGGLLSLSAAARPVSAQNYPSKPILMVSWSAAGSPVDVMAREIAKIAPKYLNQQIVVEDKTGGGTANGIAYVFSQPADGYTLLAVTDSLIVALNTTLKDKFDRKQFDFLGQLVKDPYIIGVRSQSPLKTWADLVKASKMSNLTIGGPFAESAESFFARDMGSTAGVKFQWVPYNGGAPAVAATLGGHVDAVCTNVSAVASFVQAGQMRVLAVSTAHPTPALPGTPTFAQLGFKSLTNAHWRGIAAKAGLPDDVRSKLIAFTKQVSTDPSFKSYCEKVHLALDYADPSELAKTIAMQESTVRKLIAEGVGAK
jgi:tripartite-type tricarboxylate transporter receptor subunit TctC